MNDVLIKADGGEYISILYAAIPYTSAASDLYDLGRNVKLMGSNRPYYYRTHRFNIFAETLILHSMVGYASNL